MSEHPTFSSLLSRTQDVLREALISEQEAYLEVSRAVGGRKGVFGIPNRSLQTGGAGPSGKGTTETLTLCCSKQQPEAAPPDRSPSESAEGF